MMPASVLTGTSAYNLTRQRCGLSQREAAAHHGVSINTVDKWCAGKRTVPPGVMQELQELYQIIRRAGGALGARMDALKRGEEDEPIEIGVAVTDADARALGFPSAGAHHAAVGLALIERKRISPVELVPYRSGVFDTASIRRS